MTPFEDTYLSPIKHAFTGYSGTTMLLLLSNIYDHYSRILATDFADNDTKLREAFNPDNPLESLYMRLNKCIDYATVGGDPITEGQIMRIAYSLIKETGKFQENC